MTILDEGVETQAGLATASDDEYFLFERGGVSAEFMHLTPPGFGEGTILYGVKNFKTTDGFLAIREFYSVEMTFMDGKTEFTIFGAQGVSLKGRSVDQKNLHLQRSESGWVLF